MGDYNAVSDSLKTMKTELVGFHQEMKSMESKIQIWSRNVNLMESRQSQLRLKLMDLGVNISSFSEQGTFMEGFQELISTPATSSATPTTASLGAPTPASSSATLTTASLGAPTPASSLATLTTASLGAPTTATSSGTSTTDIDNTLLGSPPAAFTSKKDNAVSTTAEVHAESTAETTEELEVVKTVEGEETPRTEANLAVMQALGWPKKSTGTPSSTMGTPTASTAVSFISNLPLLPVLPTAPNFNFPTVSAGTAAATSSTPSQILIQQSVVSVGGQNVLVSGAGPIQVAGRSMRWGRVLKGRHNYFCF